MKAGSLLQTVSKPERQKKIKPERQNIQEWGIKCLWQREEREERVEEAKQTKQNIQT